MTKKILVKKNSVAIIGWDEGNAGQVHSWLEKQGQYHVACFVHVADKPIDIDIDVEKKKRDSQLFNYPTKTSFKDKPLITAADWTRAVRSAGIGNVLVTTGDKALRLRRIHEAREAGLKPINAIHPSAVVFDTAVLHENIIIHAGAIIGYLAELHDGVIVNTGAQIDHHNILRECVTIDPGVITAGNVTIDTCAQVHTAAVIKNRVHIGKNSILGAGTVIIGSVPDDVTVVGVPGKSIKWHKTLAKHG